MKFTNHLRTLAAALLLASLPSTSHAATLSVPLVKQVHPDSHGNLIGQNWCWAASSKMVLDYYGYSKTMEELVTYGLGDPTYDMWNYCWGTGTEVFKNVGVWQLKAGGGYELKYSDKRLSYNGLAEILEKFSKPAGSTQPDIQVGRVNKQLTQTEIESEINDHAAPFVVLLGWYDAAGKRNGGHFIVCYGTSSGMHQMHDPVAGDYVKSDSALRAGKMDSNYKWDVTITTSKSLDLVFLFDSTGSMGGLIAGAKSSAISLLGKISGRFKDSRFAVADYKDLAYPAGPGGSGDYVFKADLAFTTNPTAVQSAINGLSASGGGDTPESVFSALKSTLTGSGISPWRTDKRVRRLVILIGDAPGHDPEPWAGGSSFAEVKTLATNPALPISVHALWVGGSIDAGNQYKAIAGGAGGSVVQVESDGTDVEAGLQSIVDSVADAPRFPKGEVSSIYPTFTFESIGQPSMAAGADHKYLELQKYNAQKKKWKRFRLVKLQDLDATIYQSTSALPVGQYRWRLGFHRPASKLFLPASLDTTTVAASTDFENDFFAFDRVESLPGKVIIESPKTGQPEASTVQFTFGAVAGATKYALQIFANEDRSGKPFKKYIVSPPSDDPTAPVLGKTVKGLNTHKTYSWRVQALNFDRKKPVSTAWTNSSNF